MAVVPGEQNSKLGGKDKEKRQEDMEVINVDEDDFELDYPEDYPDYYPSESIFRLAQDDKVSILEKREDIRGRLALTYTIATFVMFVLGFAVAILDAHWRETSIIDNLSTILPLLSGIFLGSLGFVLGYYFRRMDSEDKLANIPSKQNNPAINATNNQSDSPFTSTLP